MPARETDELSPDLLQSLLETGDDIAHAGAADAVLVALVTAVRQVADTTWVTAEARHAGQVYAAASWGDTTVEPRGGAILTTPIRAAGIDHGELSVALGPAHGPPVDAPVQTAVLLLAHAAGRGLARTRPGSSPAAVSSLAMVAHDIKGPLTTILGFAETLKAGTVTDPERVGELLGLIGSQARRINRLVSNVLELEAGAGELSLEYSTVRVADVVGEAVAETAGALGTLDGVTVSCPDDLVAEVDAMRVHQAVANLLWNATLHGQAPYRIDAAASDDDLTITVRDAGSGVADEMIEAMFQPYSPGATGSGLGLAIVAAVADAHGGAVDYSRADDMSCFALRLPLTRPRQ